jgi:hypothetical protein
MVLPSPDLPLVSLQMAVAGLLDFPAKIFALDAGLYDSYVVGYAVTGDMAFRLGFGDNAKFLLSIGGFNPAFEAPPAFPELRRVAIELGVNGNPSLVASGYFALTSNTAQIGASIELRASGYGLSLRGWLGLDALFVFSPFSFTAGISAGVTVSFHGAKIGVTLRGSLSGPTPWHIKGKVCVSLFFWDACLPIDHKFGNDQPASLPEVDPWDGRPDVQVRGLREAIIDERNWSGSPPPAGFAVISLSQAATAERTPIDPMGAATLRQKVVPLNRVLEKFGEYKPIIHDQFFLGQGSGWSVTLNAIEVTEVEVVKDDFAPAHFMELSKEERLSMDSYEEMDAGISIAPNRIDIGSAQARTMEYVTKFIDDEGQVFDDNNPPYIPTQAQLIGFLKRSAAALGGVRRTGAEQYKSNKPKKVTLGPRTFVVVDRCSSVANTAITGTGVSRGQALLALRSHVRNNPEDAGHYTVAPGFAVLPAA